MTRCERKLIADARLTLLLHPILRRDRNLRKLAQDKRIPWTVWGIPVRLEAL